MSFKPEVFVDNRWNQNGLVFETESEALANARNLMARWYLVENCRAVASDHAVNYRFIDGQLIAIDTKDPLEMPGHRER